LTAGLGGLILRSSFKVCTYKNPPCYLFFLTACVHKYPPCFSCFFTVCIYKTPTCYLTFLTALYYKNIPCLFGVVVGVVGGKFSKGLQNSCYRFQGSKQLFKKHWFCVWISCGFLMCCLSVVARKSASI